LSASGGLGIIPAAGNHHPHHATGVLYGLPGYGPAATNEAQGEKFQQIKQPTDISMEPAGKLPTRHVLAAAGCGTQPLGAATVAEDAPKDAKGGPGGGRPRYRVA